MRFALFQVKMQVSDVPLQAATLAEHLQRLFAESQYDPVVCPTQVEAVPEGAATVYGVAGRRAEPLLFERAAPLT